MLNRRIRSLPMTAVATLLAGLLTWGTAGWSQEAAPMQSEACGDGKLVGKGPPKSTEQWCEARKGAHRGQRQGPYLQWFSNGQLRTTGMYAAGEKVGIWTSWHSNGTKAEEGAYQAGLKTGDWTTWHDNGVMASQGIYASGAVQGELRTWNRQGLLPAIAPTAGATEWEVLPDYSVRGTPAFTPDGAVVALAELAGVAELVSIGADGSISWRWRPQTVKAWDTDAVSVDDAGNALVAYRVAGPGRTGRVASVDESGATGWEAATPGIPRGPVGVAVQGGAVFATSWDTSGSAAWVSRIGPSGEVEWESKVSDKRCGSPIAPSTTRVVLACRTDLVGLDVESGEVVWTQRFPYNLGPGPIADSSGRIHVAIGIELKSVDSQSGAIVSDITPTQPGESGIKTLLMADADHVIGFGPRVHPHFDVCEYDLRSQSGTCTLAQDHNRSGSWILHGGFGEAFIVQTDPPAVGGVTSLPEHVGWRPPSARDPLPGNYTSLSLDGRLIQHYTNGHGIRSSKLSAGVVPGGPWWSRYGDAQNSGRPQE